MDNRSVEFIFVPFCLLSQAFQAQGIVKNWKSSIIPVVDKIMEKEWNMIQLPCPETLFKGISNSLVREPKGFKYYNVDYFKEHCNVLAIDVSITIESLIENGYKVVAILGIENSPTCASTFLYTNKGTEKKKGIFMETLYQVLKDKNIEIPFIGINRKSIKRCISKLDELNIKNKTQG